MSGEAITPTPGAPARTRTSEPTALSIGLARAHIEVLQFFRDRQALVFIFSFPLLLLFIFGSIFSGEVAAGVDFKQYFVAGMIASGVMATGFQNLAIAIPVERDDGTLKRLAGTPMPKASYFLGKNGLGGGGTLG